MSVASDDLNNNKNRRIRYKHDFVIIFYPKIGFNWVFLLYDVAEKPFPLTSPQLRKFGGTLCDAVRPPAVPDYSDDD